ncbi:MAG: flagellar type III secretion system pore protein FliP [Lachnospiraceae bacterium]|nr:flagellar type III secretion system pore protein FliP [Lachnospiraceae bacterium]
MIKAIIRKKSFSRFCKTFFLLVMVLTFIFGVKSSAHATSTDTDNSNNGISIDGNVGSIDFSINAGDEGTGLSTTIQMLLILTVITLAPSILILLTSFTRILIVLHFVRTALGLQSTPPNQILVGLSLFLTLFIMSPTLSKVNEIAVQPLSRGEITQEEAFEIGQQPIRDFMLNQIRHSEDLTLFMDIAGLEPVNDFSEIPTYVIIPSFIISELRMAFYMGFLIYIPFIIIDMVVASTLMSMGMMMLPPTTISTPFKILLFIVVDGWNLVIGEVVKTFFP